MKKEQPKQIEKKPEPQKKPIKSASQINEEKQESIEAEKTHLQAKIDEERQKLKEVKEEISKREELIPKKHFKEAVQIIEKIAKKYMNKVNIESNVDYK
jgi:ABC-type phosphate transport system auxiliary subunit